MSSYILVSLWAKDDESTCVSHEFARKLDARRAASRFLDGEEPAHEELRQSAEADPDAAIVILGHGGHALFARRNGDSWITAQGLAQILSGRRVYAFACSTFTPDEPLSWCNFARLAVDACVRTFVGHDAPVMAPLARVEGSRHDMYSVIETFIQAFIDGEDDRDALVALGRAQVDWDLPVELDLPSENPDQEGAFGWSSAAFLISFFDHLQVERKPRSLLEHLMDDSFGEME